MHCALLFADAVLCFVATFDVMNPLKFIYYWLNLSLVLFKCKFLPLHQTEIMHSVVSETVATDR